MILEKKHSNTPYFHCFVFISLLKGSWPIFGIWNSLLIKKSLVKFGTVVQEKNSTMWQVYRQTGGQTDKQRNRRLIAGDQKSPIENWIKWAIKKKNKNQYFNKRNCMLIVKFTKYMYLKNSFLFKYRTRCLISFVCIFFLVHIPFCPLQVLYLHLVLAFLFKIKSWIWIYKIQELLKTELTYPLRAPKTHGWGRATRDAKYGGR